LTVKKGEYGKKLKSFENIKNKWHQEIQHHCSGAPFAIVGLKNDDHRAVSNEKGKKN